jgi:hypothetical protein
MNEIVLRFFERRGISTEIELNPYLIDAIEIFELVDEEVNKLLQENIECIQHEIVWSVVHDIYKKCREFTGGALAAFLIAHTASAEVLCRTAIESAVNLHYVSCGDDIENVIIYFRSYISTERKQNDLWLKSLENSNYSDEERNMIEN